MASLWHKNYALPKIKKNKPSMLIKLDMSKDFDYLSWDFHVQMRAGFRFYQSHVYWVRQLVSSTFFVILIKGSPSSPFNPSRGIK
jgi:hypothetical protein